MKYFNKILPICIIVIGMLSCNKDKNESDAFGNFEALETFVSSELSGKLLELNIVEGQNLKAGEQIGIIDTTMLYLNLDQLLAKKAAVSANISNVNAQIDLQNEQKRILLIEKNRIQNMLNDGAATEKNMDDINGKIAIIEKQIQSIHTQYNKISKELISIDKQSEIIKDQISRCFIKSPINGTVLEKYSMAHEMTMAGKVLFKISDISTLIFRAYISGDQLNQVKIGQEVEILTDSGRDEISSDKGVVSWISPKAEFTPKIIQTREERVNLVYAIKIRVNNDGKLKIGMPGEVIF